jgi:hypothetical protein
MTSWRDELQNQQSVNKVAKLKQQFGTLSTHDLRSRLNDAALPKEAQIALRELIQSRELGSSEVLSIIQRAKAIAAQIIDGSVAPYDGAKLICPIMWELPNGDHALDGFVYWEDEYISADTDDRRDYCRRAILKVAEHLLADRYPGGPNWDENATSEEV